MRYLITGGVGHIGSHLTDYLMARGDDVTVVDIRPISPSSRAHYVCADVHRDAPALAPLIEQHDAVFHLAAVVGFANVMASPATTVLTCMHGSHAVFDACRRYGKRVLFTSTSACYGRQTNGGTPAVETDDGRFGPPTTTSWSYAYAKAADEALAFALHREHDLPVIVARLFNVVGPRQSAEAGFVLPRFAKAAVAGEPMVVHTPGTQTRTFGHVHDCVVALAALMETDAAVGELVNVGGTDTVSMIELAACVRAAANSDSLIDLRPAPYGPGYDNVIDRVPNLDKLRQLIGYAPRWTLADAIEQVVAEQRAMLVTA